MHITEMNKYEIDYYLLFQLMWNTPADYDILDVKFEEGNIQVVTSFDYKKAERKRQESEQAAIEAEFKETLKTFTAALDKHFDNMQNGILPEPKRPIPKKRGRPRKNETKT